MKRILICADASPEVGTGHMMRCLSIAKELCHSETECIFLLNDHRLTRFFENSPCKTVVLNSAQHSFLAAREEVQHAINTIRPDFVLVDSYTVTPEYLRSLQKMVPVIYFDDFAAMTYPVAGIINYGIAANSKEYQKLYRARNTQLILGTNYTPLREEFCICTLHPMVQTPKNVLLTVGGADPFCISTEILQHLLRQPCLQQMVFQIVLGRMSPTVAQITKLSENYPDRVCVHQNVTDMAGLMQNCDLAISAGGSTLYELCTCGVPTISFAYADNQHPNTKEFDRQGIIPYAGDWRADENGVLKKITAYLADITPIEKRNTQRQKMRNIVDGQGAKRLASALLDQFVEKF